MVGTLSLRSLLWIAVDKIVMRVDSEWERKKKEIREVDQVNLNHFEIVVAINWLRWQARSH